MWNSQAMSVPSRLSAGANLDEAGRTQVGPGEFFLARPHQLDRLARGLGEARGFDGGFAGVLAAVAAAHVGLDDADLRCGKMEGLHQFVAHAEGALGAGPDGELAGAGPRASVHSATAARGSSGAWAMYSHGVAVFDLDVGGGESIGDGAGDVLRRLSLPGSGLAFRYSNRPSLEGCGGTFHCASMAETACCAVYASGATTPMKSPSWTSLTPGSFSARAGVEGCQRGVEPVGRSTAPKSMPGRTMSEGTCAYR